MKILEKLSLFAVITACSLIVLGAYVRLSDAGLGCPDWPGCFGTLTVPQSELAIHEAQKLFFVDSIEVGKAWKEMIHRYVAGFLGILIFVLGYFSYKNSAFLKVKKIIPSGLILLVIFQALLGMWTVTLLLKPIIVSLHLMGGMAIMSLLTFFAYRHSANFSKVNINSLDFKLIRILLILLFVQVFLGGWTSTNYAGLACTDFPTCHGEIIPKLDFFNAFNFLRDLGQSSDGSSLKIEAYETIQWTHRIGAYIVALYVLLIIKVIFKYEKLKFVACLLGGVLILQIIIGVSNLLLHLPIFLATMHTFGAVLLILIATLLNSKIFVSPDKV